VSFFCNTHQTSRTSQHLPGAIWHCSSLGEAVVTVIMRQKKPLPVKGGANNIGVMYLASRPETLRTVVVLPRLVAILPQHPPSSQGNSHPAPPKLHRRVFTLVSPTALQTLSRVRSGPSKALTPSLRSEYAPRDPDQGSRSGSFLPGVETRAVHSYSQHAGNALHLWIL